ncbi:hypothetical protein [Kitasatospora sp. NPDC085879]|uniref:hypothetical protein n=1 Tax=Kitasatospora sp. NPDC085879 TaxID=3154769 RepID=UPI00342B9AC1
MDMWASCLWGLGGAAAIEAWALHEAINAAGGFPWKRRGRPRLAPYAVAVVIRLSVGTVVTAACAASHQVAGPAAALAIGVAAPKILQQTFRRIPEVPPIPPAPTGPPHAAARRTLIVPPAIDPPAARENAPGRRRERRGR